MAVNAANARIFGSDLDGINLAPIGTPLPASINAALDGAFEDVGWLHEDGIKEAATGSKEVVRGYQGAKVVRSRVNEPGTTIDFTALESKPQTKSLRYNEKSVTTVAGVRQVTRGAGQTVKARAAVICFYDFDNTTIKEVWAIPRLEIVPNGDREYVNSDIAGFPFQGEIIGDYYVFEGAGTVTGTGWTVTISGTPTGGTFTIQLNGATTAPIAYNAAGAAVAAALNALSGVTGVSGVTGTGSAGGPFSLTFPAAAALVANGSALTGGTNPAVTATTP
ncbi:hypothetical protein ACFVU2_21085 [Leifsonia sp. NPDC058194]|uniref:phage tail tube protein n=1 Tax=Leifsonia sp. NPDC058194 TaxID=3346374 RepID=UPI0036DBC5D2